MVATSTLTLVLTELLMHLKCVVAVTRFQSTEAFSVIADIIILLLMPNFIDHSLLLPVVILS